MWGCLTARTRRSPVVRSHSQIGILAQPNYRCHNGAGKLINI